jgi:hypothetical protein
MDLKVLLGFIATGLAIISYIPYIRDMRRGRTKPHAFSWLIWTIITYIAGAAQLAGGGGWGSMVAFTTGTISAWIAFYAFRHRAITITKGDWISLVIALGAIPLWLFTKQPLLSVIIVSIIDLVAFWITIRKTYNLPYSENLAQNLMSTGKHVLTIGAQQHYSWVTILYPVSLAFATASFCIMLLIRRSQVGAPKHESTDILPG